MTFVCKNCRDTFNLPSEDTRIKFCSEICAREFHKYQKKPKEDRKCKRCGKTYKTNIPHQLFCNPNCKREFEKQEWEKSHTQYKKKCKQCFKWFKTTDNRKDYCCQAHYDEAKRIRNRLKYWKKKRSSYDNPIPGFE